MRAGIGFILAAAAAAAGCKSLGLYEESSRSDLSGLTTKAGGYLDLGDPHKVKLVKFETDFKAAPGRVNLEIQNDGPPEDFLSFEVEFGFPAPPGAIAPYDPVFEAVDFAELKAGDKVSKSLGPVTASKVPPLFARVVTTKGADVRLSTDREPSSAGLREGSRLLGGRVEVVKIEGNLIPPEGQKPTLTYTIESMSDTEIGNVRYMVQFYKDGKLIDLGRRFSTFRPAGKPLGKRGDRLTLEVAGLENATGSLAGVKPVLRVIQ